MLKLRRIATLNVTKRRICFYYPSLYQVVKLLCVSIDFSDGVYCLLPLGDTFHDPNDLDIDDRKVEFQNF